MLWPATAPYRAMNLHDSQCAGAGPHGRGARRGGARHACESMILAETCDPLHAILFEAWMTLPQFV